MEHKQIHAMFQFAAGSVCGVDHVRAGRNNQDAWRVRAEPECIAAVVCDGCGSSPRAEAGAIIGAELVAESLVSRASELVAREPERPDPAAVVRHLAGVRDDVLARLRVLALSMGGRLEETVHSTLLFTVVGLWITRAGLVVFSLGDGTVAINGAVHHLGPYENNAPPYLGYGLLGEPDSFRIHAREPLSAVESVLIGTDGVSDLEAAAREPLPGPRGPVGALCQLWCDDGYFRNPDALRRHLVLANRTVRGSEGGGPQRKHGLLLDDTTLVVLRRREGSA